MDRQVDLVGELLTEEADYWMNDQRDSRRGIYKGAVQGLFVCSVGRKENGMDKHIGQVRLRKGFTN